MQYSQDEIEFHIYYIFLFLIAIIVLFLDKANTSILFVKLFLLLPRVISSSYKIFRNSFKYFTFFIILIISVFPCITFFIFSILAPNDNANA